jgi:hypothetical protein
MNEVTGKKFRKAQKPRPEGGFTLKDALKKFDDISAARVKMAYELAHKKKPSGFVGSDDVERALAAMNKNVKGKHMGGSMGGGMNPGGYSKDPTVESVVGYNPNRMNKGGVAGRLAKRGYGKARS